MDQVSEKIWSEENVRYLNILGCKAQVEEYIGKFLSEGKKVYIPTNCKNWSLSFFRRVQTQFPKLKFKIYNEENKLEKDDDLISDMINYDGCIITHNFRPDNLFTKRYFDLVCGYFSGASCGPQRASQLIMRVRNLKDSNVYIYVDNSIGDKKMIPGVNSFDDMVNFMKEYVSELNGEIEFAVSQTELRKLKIKPGEQLNMDDPVTYLAIINKYNMNEGYKDYTLKLMRLLKGMGFKFGKNLVPTLSEEIEKMAQDEKLVTQKVKKTRRAEEIKYLKGLVNAIIPDEKAYEEIATKIKNCEATQEERLQITKKDILNIVNISDTNISKTQIFKKALAIRNTKRVLNKLLPTLVITLPTNKLEMVLKNTFNNLNRYEGEDVGNKHLDTFYMLTNTEKTKNIIFLYSILRILGFEYGFFDVLARDITSTKQAASDYLIRNNKEIEKTFGVSAENLKKPRSLIKWLNDKLKSLLDISFNKSSAGNLYFIKSDWVVSRDEEKFEVCNALIEFNNIDHVNYEKYFIEVVPIYSRWYVNNNSHIF